MASCGEAGPARAAPIRSRVSPGRLTRRGTRTRVIHSASRTLASNESNERSLSLSWRALPTRYRAIAVTSLAYIICSMDKVNLSIAIVPMSSELSWSKSTGGFVQGAFFIGYAIAQLPGGAVNTKFGGDRVLPVGVLVWSVATGVLPLCASSITAFALCRVLIGIGEGVSPGAAVDLIGRKIPPSERSRCTAVAFGGFAAGNIVGLLLSPAVIDSLGWRSVFYLFAIVGIGWTLFAPGTYSRSPDAFSNTHAELESSNSPSTHLRKVPWRRIVTNQSVMALSVCHFTQGWGTYVLGSWLPSFFTEKLHLRLETASLLALLPPLLNLGFSAIATPLADYFISNGWSRTLIRKLCQVVAFGGAGTGMLIAALSGDKPVPTVTATSIGLGLTSFSFGGLYSTHQDLSPTYASTLLGVTNVLGALPGVLGTELTGWMLERGYDWTDALFTPCVLVYGVGLTVFTVFGSAEQQGFAFGEGEEGAPPPAA